MSRRLFRILSPLLAALLACTSAPACSDEADKALNFREYAGTLYVSGGIGADEQEAIAQVGQDFNLKLMFAERDGSWLADVDVQIVAADGRKVLEAQANGPFLLARLPAGNYRVQAVSAGKTLERKTAVSGSARRTLVFYW